MKAIDLENEEFYSTLEVWGEKHNYIGRKYFFGPIKNIDFCLLQNSGYLGLGGPYYILINRSKVLYLSF